MFKENKSITQYAFTISLLWEKLRAPLCIATYRESIPGRT